MANNEKLIKQKKTSNHARNDKHFLKASHSENIPNHTNSAIHVICVSMWAFVFSIFRFLSMFGVVSFLFLFFRFCFSRCQFVFFAIFMVYHCFKRTVKIADLFTALTFYFIIFILLF